MNIYIKIRYEDILLHKTNKKWDREKQGQSHNYELSSPVWEKTEESNRAPEGLEHWQTKRLHLMLKGHLQFLANMVTFILKGTRRHLEQVCCQDGFLYNNTIIGVPSHPLCHFLLLRSKSQVLYALKQIGLHRHMNTRERAQSVCHRQFWASFTPICHYGEVIWVFSL